MPERRDPPPADGGGVDSLSTSSHLTATPPGHPSTVEAFPWGTDPAGRMSHGPSLDALDLVSIRLLLAVDETGSISKAAGALNMTQPSASARLRRLEVVLGVPLFERRHAGTCLTRGGRLIAAWATQVMAAVDGLRAAVGALSGGAGHPVRVAASLTIAEHLLPAWLSTLSTAMPDAAVSLFVGNSAAVCARVLNGEADVGFIESPELPPPLLGVTFATDEVVMVAGPTHPLARCTDPIDASELGGSALFVRERGSGTRAIAETVLGDLSGRLLVHEIHSPTAARVALAVGTGVAILSALSVREDVLAHRLVPLLVTGFPVARPLRIVWRSTTPRDPVTRKLMEIAHSHEV